jgi:hypothetical protein
MLEEWGSTIRDNYSSMIGKNSPNIPWLIFNFLRVDTLPRSHRCEWKNGPNDSFYIIILFMEVDIR